MEIGVHPYQHGGDTVRQRVHFHSCYHYHSHQSDEEHQASDESEEVHRLLAELIEEP